MKGGLEGVHFSVKGLQQAGKMTPAFRGFCVKQSMVSDFGAKGILRCKTKRKGERVDSLFAVEAPVITR